MQREAISALADLVAPARGMRSVIAQRFEAAGTAASDEGCWVVEEMALRIEVQDVGDYTLMCTPTGSGQAAGYLAADGPLGDVQEPGALALAAGFLLTEGLIDGLGDVTAMAVCPESESRVQVRLADPGRVRSVRRSGLVTSSCGVCANVDGLVELGDGATPVEHRLAISADALQQHMLTMRSRQAIFGRTGGTHAAALFAADGRLLALAEDLGRHNALDKVIGHCLLHGLPARGGCVTLSGRISLEMITKAVRAGIELVAAVSAPSSMAIEAAQRVGITLCGFVRGDRLTTFSHPQRLHDAP